MGNFKAPKSAILKVNNSISLSNMAGMTLQMVLLKPDAVVDPYTVSTFTGDLASAEQNYSGYARQTLSGVTRIDTIQDGYIWTANDVTFEGLNAGVRYGLIIDSATNNIISIMDLGDTYTFAGDITFSLNVYGFFGIKV